MSHRENRHWSALVAGSMWAAIETAISNIQLTLGRLPPSDTGGDTRPFHGPTRALTTVRPSVLVRP
jgi:hypothetical protein